MRNNSILKTNTKIKCLSVSGCILWNELHLIINNSDLIVFLKLSLKK